MRTMPILASLAMLTVLGASGLAAAPQPQFVFIGEDQDGNVIVQPLGASDHYTSCGGTAPTITHCTSGPHTPAAGPTSYVHGFVFPAVFQTLGTFVGSASSTVSDGTNTRTFVCTTAGGQAGLPAGVPAVYGVIGCAGVGTKPSGTFNQSCTTYFLGTVPAGGVEGGVGDWQCIVDGQNGYPAP